MATHSKGAKPAKPHPDFPLTAHANGQWCKKVRGKVHFFGVWPDPDAALEKWLQQKDDLLAGRQPRTTTAGVTIEYMCNHFLQAKEARMNEGSLTRCTWQDYKDTCQCIVKVFGRTRAVADLMPTDFQQLRAYLAKGCGPETLGNDIQRSRCVFKYGYDMRLIDRPADFGPDFRRPSKQVRRKARLAKPLKMLSADEIRKLLGIASTQMKAMVLLGVNVGLGNSDCAGLRMSHIDLKAGTLDYPRPKTSIERRAMLWPETVTAIQKALDVRPQPKDPADADLVFVTKYGAPWVQYRSTEEGRGSHTNSVSREFEKLMKDLKINRKGVNFYALRHVLETVGSGAGDQAALDRVMGHEGVDMATHYRKWLKDDEENARLRKIADHVRAWLFQSKPQHSRSRKTSGNKASTNSTTQKPPQPLRLVSAVPTKVG